MVLLAHLFDAEAKVCFEEAARLNPKEPLWPYALGQIAKVRDPERAPALLRRAARAAEAGHSAEHRDEYWLQLAEVLLEHERREEAESIFREVRRRDPKNLRAALGLAMIVKESNPDKARALFEEAHASPFAQKAAAGQLAVLARAAGDLKAADRYEQEVAGLEADKPWPDPLLDVTADMIVGRRGRERRITLLEQEGARERKPEERIKRYQEAADLELEQVEKAPTARAYAGAAVNLSRVVKERRKLGVPLQSANHARPLALMRQALELDPEGVQTNYTLALVLLQRAQEEGGSRAMLREAVTHAKKAAQGKRDHAGAYRVWGQALLLLREPAAAVEPLRTGLACRPGDFDMQLALGEALLATGKAKEAREHLENARRLKPGDPLLRAALERADAGK
jgi:tetratricopeptide (TPR) repeat protein